MRILVGVSGASGAIYAVRVIEELVKQGHEVFLICSEAGAEILSYELGKKPADLGKMVVSVFDNDDLFSGPASGSFLLDAMVIVPCSMKSVAAVAQGFGDTLMSRAALCQLKEGRKLVMVIRETPLELAGLRNMVALKEAGVCVLPASPGFYHKPNSVDDLVDFIVGKVLDQVGIAHSLFTRWSES